MKSKEEIIASLRSRLVDDRFIHSLNVADMAEELAEIHNCDKKKAYLAGLVHDCTKNTPYEKQFEIMNLGGMKLTPLEIENKKLWHAMSGSVFIKSEYDINDEEIISAVRYHTTGKADMSLLEKIVYVADFTSAERDYKSVEKIREEARKNINTAVYIGAEFTVRKITSLGGAVHPDTVNAMNYYKEG